MATRPGEVRLDPLSALEVLHLPVDLEPSPEVFERLWALHPERYHTIRMAGRPVETPRWQQAYGEDYRYTGRVNRALPIPPLLEPLLTWSREAIDPRLNGLLLNWYDPDRAHYIGKHRDSTSGLVEGAPIVTISCGGERVFRLRPWRPAVPEADARVDVPVAHGTVLVMPWAVNLSWTHEVPWRPTLDRGRRISITVRAFEEGGA